MCGTVLPDMTVCQSLDITIGDRVAAIDRESSDPAS